MRPRRARRCGSFFNTGGLRRISHLLQENFAALEDAPKLRSARRSRAGYDQGSALKSPTKCLPELRLQPDCRTAPVGWAVAGGRPARWSGPIASHHRRWVLRGSVGCDLTEHHHKHCSFTLLPDIGSARTYAANCFDQKRFDNRSVSLEWRRGPLPKLDKHFQACRPSDTEGREGHFYPSARHHLGGLRNSDLAARWPFGCSDGWTGSQQFSCHTY